MIQSLEKSNINDMSLVIGTKGECWNQESYEAIKSVCEKHGVKLILNFENDRSQNSFSLLLAIKQFKRTSVIGIDGDVLLSRHVLSSIHDTVYDTFIVSKRTKDLSEVGTRIVTNRDRLIVDVGKNIIPVFSPWYIYSGVIKIGEIHFESFREMLSKEEYKPLDLSHPLKEFSEKFRLYNLELNQGWININTSQDLEIARDLWRALKCES